MERRTAERNATLYRAFFETQAESESLDPHELFRSYNLNISQQLPEALTANNLDSLDPVLNEIREKATAETDTAPEQQPQTSEPLNAGERSQDVAAIAAELDRLGLPVAQMDNDSIKAALRRMESRSPIDSETVLSQGSEGDETSAGNRGRIRFNRDDKRFQIELMENANLSTFLHESGHFFLEVLGDLSSRDNASERVRAQYQSLLEWLEVPGRDSIATRARLRGLPDGGQGPYAGAAIHLLPVPCLAALDL